MCVCVRVCVGRGEGGVCVGVCMCVRVCCALTPADSIYINTAFFSSCLAWVSHILSVFTCVCIYMDMFSLILSLSTMQ